METELGLHQMLSLQIMTLEDHKKECQICPIARYECKTFLIVSDRISLLQKIINA